ncbi:MAG TPA: gluconokinase [Saprospiraceae bacterium]|nr:gluconokinase [Saprospiraceae bacterium]
MLIGIDIGTTNVKAVACSDTGEVLASAERPNKVLSPQPGRSEQEPEAVFQNVLAVLEDVIRPTTSSRLTSALQGIVFSSAMHGLAALDGKGQPLTNFLLWSDLRADPIAQQLRQSKEGVEIYRRTGVPVHAMSPLCKLIWLRQNRPDIFQKAHKFLGIKEYVWYRLTGKYEADLSIASATGLMNIHRNKWDEAAMALADISSEQLPALVSPSFTTQFSDNPRLSESFKLSESSLKGAPLIIGASDGALANLGSGATEPGQVAVTIGTSAAIRTMTDVPVPDDQMRTFCYRLDERRCILGGASNNGTNALEWLRSSVMRSQSGAEQFANQALGVPPGSDDLLFLPYLLGERAPLYRASASGSFQGLTGAHGQAHFVRAVMEGVLFNLKIIAGALEAHHPLRTLHAGGGFSKNRLWVQMLADIFQKPVLVNENDADASVLGALKFARTVLNLPQMPDNQRGRVVEPDVDKADVYEAAFQRFKALIAFE